MGRRSWRRKIYRITKMSEDNANMNSCCRVNSEKIQHLHREVFGNGKPALREELHTCRLEIETVNGEIKSLKSSIDTGVKLARFTVFLFLPVAAYFGGRFMQLLQELG